MKNPFSTDKTIAHNCDWELLSKTYAAPIASLPNNSVSEETMEKALLGVTSLLWECRVCREFRKEEVLGSDENQVENLLDKVDAQGPQYLYRGNNTYMIGIMPQEQVLPVR